MNDGIKKFEEVGQKLKAEVAEKQAKEEKGMEIAKNQLEAIQGNTQLLKMYQDNAKVGAENLAGESPLLKVHALNKSKSELADGKEPNDGWFFYKPTGEQFESPIVHILSISQGFRAPSLEEGKKDQFNQIVGGVLVDDNEDYKPFIMYFSGLKLRHLWDFSKELGKYTRGRPLSIPMFALSVKLTSEKQTTDYGKVWVVNFEVLKSEDNFPVLITDTGRFQVLRNMVEMIEDQIAALVQSRSAKEEEPTPVTVIEDSPQVDVNPADIPF